MDENLVLFGKQPSIEVKAQTKLIIKGSIEDVTNTLSILRIAFIGRPLGSITEAEFARKAASRL